MRLIFFWKKWPDPYRTIYKSLLILFVITIGFYATTYVIGNEFVIHWDTITNIVPVSTLFDTFYLGHYEFPINVDNYVLQRSFEASDLQIQVWPAYLLLSWLAVFIIIVLSIIPSLSRFWFLVSAVLFTILLIGLKLDYLVLFNQYNKLGILMAFVIYYPTMYVFHFIKKDVKLLLRIGVNTLATIIFGILIYRYSYVDLPFLHLVNYGIYVPLILSIVFTFMIGHEVISGLLKVISGGAVSKEKGGLFHFLIISVIYLLNVALLLLKNTRVMEIDIYLIGAFFILTFASVVGIWGYRSREITYQGTYSFFPHGALIYLLLAITTHLTLAYFFILGNDFMMEVIEDAIVFSQLGYGTMFLVYFIANFYDIFRQNKDVSKIVYKPIRMPYFTARFAGLIAILALFLRFNMTPYHQAIAGFYTGIGDLYLLAEDYPSAREYYNISTTYSSTSHRGNYALATLERSAGNTDDEIRYLREAIGKNASEFAFANLASRLKSRDQILDALFMLEDGLVQNPNSGPLHSNLGLVYLELNNIDSTFYHFNTALDDRQSIAEAEANIYALLRMQDLSIRADTLDYLLEKRTSIPVINNLIVLSNELHKPVDDLADIQFKDPESTGLDQIVYNYNKMLNQPSLVDSALLAKMTFFYDSTNTSFFEDNMQQAAGLALYRQGNLSAAFDMLTLLAINNPEDEFNSLLGKLALKNGAYALAADYYKHSFQNGHPEAASELAFAYMENDELDKSAFLWGQLALGSDSAEVQLARNMLRVIEAGSLDDVLYADTDIKLAFIIYRTREFDPEKLEDLTLSFENDDAKALAFLELFSVYQELQNRSRALEMLSQAGQIAVSRPHIIDKINLAQCSFAYHFNDLQLMTQLRTNLKSEDRMVRDYLELFEIMTAEETTRSGGRFGKLAMRNPFFEPGVLEAVNYFNSELKNPDRAYQIVLNAVNHNPFSIQLNKSYALQCIRVGLINYAEDVREELRQAMNSVAFETFDRNFRATLEEYESNTLIW